MTLLIIIMYFACLNHIIKNTCLIFLLSPFKIYYHGISYNSGKILSVRRHCILCIACGALPYYLVWDLLFNAYPHIN